MGAPVLRFECRVRALNCVADQSEKCLRRGEIQLENFRMIGYWCLSADSFGSGRGQ
jgi:hypothetical protein